MLRKTEQLVQDHLSNTVALNLGQTLKSAVKLLQNIDVHTTLRNYVLIGLSKAPSSDYNETLATFKVNTLLF